MNNEQALQTAETIFEQFGGKKRLVTFVGANNFQFHNRPEVEQVDASFKFKMCRKANLVKVTYHRCPDVYTVKFFKLGKTSIKVVSEFNHIYCDQLIELFEKETDLYLHF